jgi:hypothetical protein
VRKEDGLSFVFLGIYVPWLTPHLNGTAISLQLSENITLFAVLTKLSVPARCIASGLTQ